MDRSPVAQREPAQDCRVKPVFLHQHTGGQRRLIIAWQDRDNRLTQDRTGVEVRRHLMHGATGLPVTCGKGAGMGVQARIVRQERGVDVQHPALVPRDEPRRQDPHEPGKAQDVGPCGVDVAGQFRLEGRAVLAEGAVIDGGDRHAQRRRHFQTAGRGIVRQDQHRPRRMVPGHRPDQGKHVRATPGNQDGNALHRTLPL